MQNALNLLIFGILVFWLGRFVLGLMRGRVKGAHPIEKKFSWIDRGEHPKHFWVFTLLQVILLVIFACVIFGLRIAPAY